MNVSWVSWLLTSSMCLLVASVVTASGAADHDVCCVCGLRALRRLRVCRLRADHGLLFVRCAGENTASYLRVPVTFVAITELVLGVAPRLWF